jgi:hypothetical protein
MQQSSTSVGRALTAEEVSQVGGGIAPLVALGYFGSGFFVGLGIGELSIKAYEVAMHHLKC